MIPHFTCDGLSAGGAALGEQLAKAVSAVRLIIPRHPIVMENRLQYLYITYIRQMQKYATLRSITMFSIQLWPENQN